jgi:hypothetical protein
MKKRWIVLAGIFGLPAFLVARRIEWWFHEESGLEMAGALEGQRISNVEPDVARAFVSETCGESVEFDRTDKSAYWATMPEKAIAKHFTLYGLFRNTIWVAVGTHGRFCLARYEIAQRRHGCVWPFPYCNYASWKSLDEVRLVERIQTRPKVPPGTQALFPGECATGELPAGASIRFQVEVPSFGQRVEVFAAGDNPGEAKLEFELTKNGLALESTIDEAGGGTYVVLARAPLTDFKRYVVSVRWGLQGGGCPNPPQGWRYERSTIPGHE